MDSIDDKEDMGFVDEAFDILGFTKQEKVMKLLVQDLSVIVLNSDQMIISCFNLNPARRVQACGSGYALGRAQVQEEELQR